MGPAWRRMVKGVAAAPEVVMSSAAGRDSSESIAAVPREALAF